MKSIKIKETYLLILIVLGLFSIAIYSTFALFSASSEINDVVSLNATLSTGSSVLEYEMIKVPAGEYKIIELNINNTYTSSLYYGAWYEVLYPENSSDVSVGLYTSENSNSSSGQLTSNGSITLLVGISNTTNEEAIVNIGTVGSLTSNLGIESPRVLLGNNWEIPVSDPALATLTKLGLTSSIQDVTLPTSFTSTSEDDDYEDGIYAVQDDIGTSYVFRGNVTNNYVKFGKYTEDAYSIATNTGSSYEYSYTSSCPNSYIFCTQIASANDDMYWRIVRINGDGSIRLIYDGTSAYANNSTSKESYNGYHIPYNYATGDAYVGYMYGTSGTSTYEATHANTNDSYLKTTLDAWYAKYLNGTSYAANIVDAIYCNDRSVNTSSITWGSYTFTGQGYQTYNTLYGINARSNLYTATLDRYNSMTPKLTCEQQNDRFSVNSSVGGVSANGALTYPVATITADEMVYAGMWNYYNTDDTTNDSDITYLFSKNGYWTMSPGYNRSSSNYVWSGYNGAIRSVYTGNDDFGYGGVRSVISLSSSSNFTGSGTQTDPFVIGS